MTEDETKRRVKRNEVETEEAEGSGKQKRREGDGDESGRKRVKTRSESKGKEREKSEVASDLATWMKKTDRRMRELEMRVDAGFKELEGKIDAGFREVMRELRMRDEESENGESDAEGEEIGEGSGEVQMEE